MMRGIKTGKPSQHASPLEGGHVAREGLPINSGYGAERAARPRTGPVSVISCTTNT
jgi:hypothetical protein